MKAKRILSIVLVLVLLASAVPLVVMPAAAIYPYEKKIPGDVDENDELTKDELSSAILPYMLDEGAYALDDVGDAAYVYAYWGGKPKTVREVVYIGESGRTVKFYRPVERMVSVSPDGTKTIIALGECDKIVAGRGRFPPCMSVEGAPNCAQVCGGRLLKIPQVSSSYGSDINVEKIVCEKPDVLIGGGGLASNVAFQKKTGIPAVRGWFHGGKYTFFENLCSQFEFFGTLLDREEEAEELKSFVEEKLDKVREVTSEIPDDEKPKVYIVSRSWKRGDFATTLPNFEPIDIAGGINVADDAGEKGGDLSLKVLKEQVIKWNPDIILINSRSLTVTVSEFTIESVLLDPELQTVNAVKNESVYYSMCPHWYGKPADWIIINTLYLAKLFHPDEFKDLDLEKEGNDIFEAFLGVDGLFSENADYLVWMREYLDEQQKS